MCRKGFAIWDALWDLVITVQEPESIEVLAAIFILGIMPQFQEKRTDYRGFRCWGEDVSIFFRTSMHADHIHQSALQ